MLKQGSDFKSQDRSVRTQIIMDTASRVFLAKGYHSASLDNVAAELGITKAALYYYFPSKEDLLAAIYIQVIEAALKGGMAIVDMDLPAPEKLRLFITRHIKETIVANISAVSVFLAEENQLSPKNQRKIRQGKRAYNNLVEGLLKEGMVQGRFRWGDTGFLANAILGMCNSLHRWYADKDHPGGAGGDRR
jgi:AcrR family transcriptional regulator